MLAETRDNSHKTPIVQTLPRFVREKTSSQAWVAPKSLPCSVVAVLSPSLVTVSFDVATTPFTLPQMTIPIIKPPYVQYPVQVGDRGIAFAADVQVSHQAGLGGGVPGVQDTVGNLGTLSFCWLGQADDVFLDPTAVSIIVPGGGCNMQIGPTGATIAGTSGNLAVAGDLSAGNGATGQFTAQSGQVITVVKGIITAIG